jgi:hypothetical protein
MKATTFWKTVVNDRSDFLDRVLALLEENAIRYCVIGGQAVNAYADPVVSLDLDIVIAVDQLTRAEQLFAEQFRTERFPHSVNVSDAGSNLRLQLQTDPRYFDFVNRATQKEVLGLDLPVADIADVLQGKVWAASDPGRRPSKRLKDLSDIARILETRPDLTVNVPKQIQEKLS